MDLENLRNLTTIELHYVYRNCKSCEMQDRVMRELNNRPPQYINKLEVSQELITLVNDYKSGLRPCIS